jgi:cobalt-zinc-cadmium resistance protein CzcA
MKTLLRTCTERPWMVLAMTLLLAAHGVLAWRATPMEAFPDVTNLQVNVIAQAPGLAAEEVERQLTVPLERELHGIPEVTIMRSESLFGLALISLVFEDDADTFKGRMRVSERLASLDLPEGTDVALAPDATPLGEIYQFRLTSDRHDLATLRAELEWRIRAQLKQIPGVADVVASGGFLEEILVEPDPARLEAHGLTVVSLVEALSGQSVNVGGGVLVQGDQELVVRGVGQLARPEDVGATLVARIDGVPVTVADVARLLRSHTPRRGSVGFNEARDVVEGFILLRRGENPGEVLEGIHARIDALNGGLLPEGMAIEPFYDRGDLLARTLGTVEHNLLHGALLVLGVVWLFLRSLRASLVVTAIIPLALLTAFGGLWLLGLPANLISMGAIDFGILVDGAVVLVEHIMHEAELHPPPDRQALRALVRRATLKVAKASSFGMAIIIAGLLPIFTLEGVEGRIFRPLALTYSFAILGALLFAVTALPALSVVSLRVGAAGSGGGSRQAQGVPSPSRYGRLVARLVRQPAWALVGAACLLTGGVVFGGRLGTEFLPELDEGDFVIFVEMPPSISLEAGQDILEEVRRRILAFPEVAATLSEHGRPEDGTDNEGVNMSETFVRLHPQTLWPRARDKADLIAEMRARLNEIPGVSFNFSQPIKDNVEEAVSGVRGKVVLKVFGQDLEQMRRLLEDAMGRIEAVPGVVDLGLYRDATAPQLVVELDRGALGRAGVRLGDAQAGIRAALGGEVVATFWQGERPVPVRVRLPLEARADAGRIGELRLPAAARVAVDPDEEASEGEGLAADQVPLSEVARLTTGTGQANILREGGERVMALKFNVQGRDMGSVVAEARLAVEPQVALPEGYRLVWTGEFENQARAMARLSLVVPLSFLGVLILLYYALGRLRGAITVLGVVPFAMTGGVFALALTDMPLGVSAAVGFITLLGGISAWALLVVSAVDGRVAAGEAWLPALVGGAVDRLRAVAMTGLLALSGLAPMAVSTGAGSEIQRPFAVVVMGGVVTALAACLLLLPVLYRLLGRPVRPRDPVPTDVRSESAAP